jgi:hypothetical protein
LSTVLSKALDADSGAPSVLLACPGEGAGVLGELRDALAQAAGQSEYTVVISTAAEPAAVQRRALLTASVGASSETQQMCFGATPQCDCVCVAQTALLQFAVVFGCFMLMALSGVCCLHALEGPGRFELSAEQKHGNAH